MDLKKFIKRTGWARIRPMIICKDGFKISVQASWGHYCTPRKKTDSYTELEVGYPSEEEGSILEYAENKDIPTQTVYGWVPYELIQEILDKHGGIDTGKTIVDHPIPACR